MRSEVEHHVVLMPMRIQTQWENGKLIALIPAWHLPTDLFVTGDNIKDALDKLERRMHQHWGTPSNPTDEPRRSAASDSI